MTKFPQLYFEAKTYKYLNSSGSVTGIPKVKISITKGVRNDYLGQIQYHANGLVRKKYRRYFCWSTQKNVFKVSFDDYWTNGW